MAIITHVYKVKKKKNENVFLSANTEFPNTRSEITTSAIILFRSMKKNALLVCCTWLSRV